MVGGCTCFSISSSSLEDEELLLEPLLDFGFSSEGGDFFFLLIKLPSFFKMDGFLDFFFLEEELEDEELLLELLLDLLLDLGFSVVK